MILDEPAYLRTAKLTGCARQRSADGINPGVEPEGSVVGEVEQARKDEGGARTVAEIAVLMQSAHIHTRFNVVVAYVDRHDVGPLKGVVTEELGDSEERSERSRVADGGRPVPQHIRDFRITAWNEIGASVEIAKPSLVDQIRIETSRPGRQ